MSDTITVLVFYKGTPLQYSNKQYDLMHRKGNEMIVSGLRNGVSLEQQKKDYLNQLDFIEEKICFISNNDEIFEEKLIANWGKEEYLKSKMLWFMNIEALIKLKVLNDDDKNGFLVISANFELQ